ncbi:GTP cyclohydrolase-2 [Thalassobium sp. R2A62]|nr:GTP cyclohydrolase-2 [Thalassobium sp. R2A62]
MNDYKARQHQMQFVLTVVERLARARSDLRMGVPVVIDGVVVLACETLDAARFELVRDRAPGRAVVAVSGRRADTLRARAYDGDIARILVPREAEVSWVRAVADPADDLRMPMKGPFQTERDGDCTPHRAAIHLAKAARLLPAVVVASFEHPLIDLVHLTADEVLDHASSPMGAVVSAHLPLSVSEAGRLHVFRPEDGGEEHYAIEIGNPDRSRPVLARLHSACFTGDLMGSLKCDCGPQLRAAMAQMGAEGAGVLLYLNQEGRGIGLANKMRAYSLQDQGFDTVEANHRLGFEDDERDFHIGSDILKKLGFTQVRLLTNNPAKIARMEDAGVKVVERVPLKVGETVQNRAYLVTKAAKSGHLL